jgi:hypothetical protein
MSKITSDTTLFQTESDDFLEKCRGSNNSLVFIGYETEENEAERLLFLRKILSALKLELDHDALFRSFEKNEPASFLKLFKKKGIEKMLLFGCSPKQFGLSIEAALYEPFEFYGCRLLFSEKLSVVEADAARKGQLWTALKKW